MSNRFPRVDRQRPHWSSAAQLSALVLVGFLIRIAFIQSAGYRDDVVIFYDWFRSIAVQPFAHVYAQTPGLNYPPMIVVMYKVEAIFFGWFTHGAPSEYVLNIAIKLPPILMDGLGAVLVYGIVRRYAPHRLALLGAAFITLNPAIIYDSAYWGQNDAIPTVLALFAIAQLLAHRTIVAWLSIAAAAFFKPPVLVLVPLMLAHPFRATGAQRRSRLMQTGWGIMGALIIAEVFAYTFFEHPNPFVATRHLVAQYIGFSNVFHYLSLSAFNIWALFWPFFASDTTKVLGVSLHVWGDLIFIAAAGSIYWRYLKDRQPAALLEAAALVLLAFFILLTEMHERYLYYAVFFFAPLVFRKPYRQVALILTLTLVLNLEYGLTFMYLDDAHATVVNRFEFAPWLIHLCSLANIGAFGWLWWSFLTRRPLAEASMSPALWTSSEATDAGAIGVRV